VLNLWNDTQVYKHMGTYQTEKCENKGQKPMSEEEAQEGTNELHTVPIH
jgi:hypothetical protein